MSSPCTIVLHVAGDAALSSPLFSFTELCSAPSISDSLTSFSSSSSLSLCSLSSSSSSSSLSSLASTSSLSSLPSEAYLCPPGGTLLPRRLPNLERKWCRGRRLRAAYTLAPGEVSDQFLLVANEFPERLFETIRFNAPVPFSFPLSISDSVPVRALTAVEIARFRPSVRKMSRAPRGIVPSLLARLPESYADGRVVPFFEVAAGMGWLTLIFPQVFMPVLRAVAWIIVVLTCAVLPDVLFPLV